MTPPDAIVKLWALLWRLERFLFTHGFMVIAKRLRGASSWVVWRGLQLHFSLWGLASADRRDPQGRIKRVSPEKHFAIVRIA